MASRSDVRRAASKAYWREADAAIVVEAWRESGQAMSTFARAAGVDRQRLARWARRLLGEGPMRFREVRLVGGPAHRSADGIEVEVLDARIRLGRGFEAEDLRRVLEVLRESAAC